MKTTERNNNKKVISVKITKYSKSCLFAVLKIETHNSYMNNNKKIPICIEPNIL